MCVLLKETHASVLLRTLILRMVDAYEIRINVRVYERKQHEIANNLIVPVKKLYRKFSSVACLSTEAPLSTVVHAHTGFVPSFKTMIK